MRDVVVVGGGPAGLSAAMWLARRGRQVTVVEKGVYPRDKPCGDGLTPRAVTELRALGLDPSSQFHQIAGLRVRAGSQSVEIPWPDSGRISQVGFVAPRAHLDALLAAAAEGRGVEVVSGSQAEPVGDAGCGVQVSVRSAAGRRVLDSRVAVVADGCPSRFARGLGVPPVNRESLGMALRGYFDTDRSHDMFFEFHLDLGPEGRRWMTGYGWVFPVGDGRVNIGVATLAVPGRGREFMLRSLLDGFIDRVADTWDISSSPVDRFRAGPLPTGLVSPCCGCNWVLVGDAAGVVNPLTGEGISQALESGRLAATAVDHALREDNLRRLRSYQVLLRRRYGSYQRWARRCLAAVGSPFLPKRLLVRGLRNRTLASFAVRVGTGFTQGG